MSNKNDESVDDTARSAKPAKAAKPAAPEDDTKKDEPSGSRWTSRVKGGRSVIRDSSAGDKEIGYVTGDEIAGYEAHTMEGKLLGKSKRYDDAKGRVVDNYKKPPKTAS